MSRPYTMEFNDLRMVLILIVIFTISIGHLSTGKVMVRAPSPKIATMGKDPLTVECMYQATGRDLVLGVNWYRKQTFDKEFRLIAQVPNKEYVTLPPTFVDRYLGNKANMSTEKKGSFQSVQLIIFPTDCQDEGTYQCEIQVYGGKTPDRPDIHVQLNEEPSAPKLEQSPGVLVENYPVTFTCTATVGRPVSSFQWYVYKNTHQDVIEETQMSGISSFDHSAGTCSPIGSSTLAVIITREDIKVKCAIRQNTKEFILVYSDEKQLDVQYSVMNTEAQIKVNNRYRNPEEEIQIAEGGTVTLMCQARGNPEPTFTWSYLPLKGQSGNNELQVLSENQELVISNVTRNNSASYVCVASNMLRGRRQSETKAVRVIVKENLSSRIGRLQRSSQKTNVLQYVMVGGIVLGAMLFVVILSLLSVMCYKKCVQMEDKKYLMQYHGVKTSHPLN